MSASTPLGFIWLKELIQSVTSPAPDADVEAITFANTTPVLVPITNRKLYHLSVTGGTLTVKRKTLAGAWVAVTGSPFAALSESDLRTHSVGGEIEVTPSVAGVEMILGTTAT